MLTPNWDPGRPGWDPHRTPAGKSARRSGPAKARALALRRRRTRLKARLALLGLEVPYTPLARAKCVFKGVCLDARRVAVRAVLRRTLEAGCKAHRPAPGPPATARQR